MIAASRGTWHCARVLLLHGSFLKVGAVGDLDIVRVMVERTQVDLDARDAYDTTPLHLAASYGPLSCGAVPV